jgi:hypothetical protein
MTIKQLLCAVTLIGACAFPIRAAEPVIGGWRAVKDQSWNNEYRFAMLPRQVPEGTKFVAIDWLARKQVCCLVVHGEEVSEDTLRNKFKIPEVWITDLVNGWSMDDAPYRPRLFVLTPNATFRAHNFAGTPAFMHGGLLLTTDSNMDSQGHIMIGQERYRGKFIRRLLADDDGAVHVYTLTPLSGGKPVIVEVPFGTN